MPSSHTYGCFSKTFVGITLFVNLQGCGRPQSADGQKVDTHVFSYVESSLIYLKPELGCYRA